jgi:hypothetical protein
LRSRLRQKQSRLSCSIGLADAGVVTGAKPYHCGAPRIAVVIFRATGARKKITGTPTT